MKLNKKQMEILLELGFSTNDIPQIERAIGKTVYSVSNYGEATGGFKNESYVQWQTNL